MSNQTDVAWNEEKAEQILKRTAASRTGFGRIRRRLSACCWCRRAANR